MQSTTKKLEQYVRAANYISAIQIYLQDNFLLERPLAFSDIKPRLLGHWGTCPGINFTYAHLNNFIIKTDVPTMFVLGPGHGFPALQANLFIEKTLKEFDPKAQQTEDGLGYIARNFSWPDGFQSHSSPSTPGVILEGGELGYALSTAYGAALDNSKLLVACLIGDGEAETGATAAAWHLNKLINPKTNGAVLPILHLNGYKISGPTIFGRMSRAELKKLFVGYGYEPLFVGGASIHTSMSLALKQSYQLIQKIKKSAGQHACRPPMIILDTPKGWTGIKTLNNKKIENNCLSHQVVVADAKSDVVQLRALEGWLRSYRFNQLFDAKKGFVADILDVVPKKTLRMGSTKYACGWENYKLLTLPDEKKIALAITTPGSIKSSSMRATGLYLKEVFRLNAKQKNVRFFSPDETYSNKLDAIFDVTDRSFQLPLKPWDEALSCDGRVIELLSEQTLQGLAQGYVLTGRHSIFASYEAFIDIVSSMAAQYAKFLKASRSILWRKSIASLNYILTSSGWRQEHNGFSHQNPGFIDSLLNKKGSPVSVYFPPDPNSTLVVFKKCMLSQNAINIVVAGKTVEPCWLSLQQAELALKKGALVWDFASDDNPDIVFCGVGDYMVKECLAAVDYLKFVLPQVRIRFVNILQLTPAGIGSIDRQLSRKEFDDLFTTDKPIIINYHGYVQTIKAVLFDYNCCSRSSVHGYSENGSTTTAFDMQVCNQTSRYHLIMEAARGLSQQGVITKSVAQKLIATIENKLEAHKKYIKQHGIDPVEISDWSWTSYQGKK
jgi:xylulose-5-phosphate/fructose-6-phosphate phosphoketolase